MYIITWNSRREIGPFDTQEEAVEALHKLMLEFVTDDDVTSILWSKTDRSLVIYNSTGMAVYRVEKEV